MLVMRGSMTTPFQDQTEKKTRMNQIKYFRMITGLVTIPFWSRLGYQGEVNKCDNCYMRDKEDAKASFIIVCIDNPRKNQLLI